MTILAIECEESLFTRVFSRVIKILHIFIDSLMYTLYWWWHSHDPKAHVVVERSQKPVLGTSCSWVYFPSSKARTTGFARSNIG
jgi:hypothetical protein